MAFCLYPGNRKFFALPGIVWATILIGLGGCSRQEIRVYEATKDAVASRTELPAGWEEMPGGGMRMGSYVVRGSSGESAQVSIVPLPGESGTDADYVNMWRTQLSLPPLKDGEAPQEAQDITIAGQRARMYELAGNVDGKPTRTLGAILKQDGTAWFFKMMGDDKLVHEQREAFVQFASRYQLARESEDVETAASTAQASPSVDTSDWHVPPGWKQAPPGPEQDARFLVDDGKATVTLSILGGSGGELLPNINRWRVQQLDLPAVTESDLSSIVVPLETSDAAGTLVDMRGPTQRMVAARIPRGDRTWYFKLMGEDAVVEQQKKAFVEFVKSNK